MHLRLKHIEKIGHRTISVPSTHTLLHVNKWKKSGRWEDFVKKTPKSILVTRDDLTKTTK